jgi:hypothetical protein
MPDARGKAKVDSKAGRLQINIDLSKLGPASKIGPQYLTYVLWAITPKDGPTTWGNRSDESERAVWMSPPTAGIWPDRDR